MAQYIQMTSQYQGDVYHAEATSAQVDGPDKIFEISNVQEKCQWYVTKDKFNMDESGLW